MKNRLLFSLLTSTLLCTGSAFAAESASVGVVNFGNCVTDSKLGKQEQASFEALKKQLSSLLEDTEKQLTEISTKLNDQEFMDGLSPEGEEELKNKFQNLNEELNRYQSQYYQVLNQANMRIIQMLSNSISTAAEKVAKDKKLTMVINKEACFFYSPQLEITAQVVSEMDRTYDQDGKKHAQAPAIQQAPVEADIAPAPASATVQAPAPAAAPKADTKTAQAPAPAPKAEAKVEAKTAQAPKVEPKADAKTAQAPATPKAEAKPAQAPKAETKTK